MVELDGQSTAGPDHEEVAISRDHLVRTVGQFGQDRTEVVLMQTRHHARGPFEELLEASDLLAGAHRLCRRLDPFTDVRLVVVDAAALGLSFPTGCFGCRLDECRPSGRELLGQDLDVCTRNARPVVNTGAMVMASPVAVAVD